MRKHQPYVDWRKELEVWQVTNTTLEVDKKIQAGILFESLEGSPRQIVQFLGLLHLEKKDF